MILLLSILLGALLEECQGLQADLLYQYEYTGTISTWMPNDPTQSSGSALRAIVALQLSQNGDIFVKASNIHVAERNGKNACGKYEHAEFPYREMDPRDAALLEKPFLVHFNRSQVPYIEVPQEPVWVTNIRRGIINTIPLVALKGQYTSRLTFGLKEDTMIGSCFNWYSMLKLASHRAKVENNKQEEIIEVDVQRERIARNRAPKGKGRRSKSKGRSKTSVPIQQITASYTAIPIDDSLSILTRTLDDQQCKDNHFTIKINGNHQSEERTQRSSEGTFLIRGEGTVLRLERAEVMGDIVIYTGEADKEFITTTSKQVLQLRSVQRLEEIIPMEYEPERRTLSFTVAEGERSTIKEKLLGISPVNQQIEANMAVIAEDLSILIETKDMEGEETPDFLKIFQRLVEHMTILSWTEIENLITHVANTERDRYIIYQASLASGRHEALTHILEEMKNQTFRRSHYLFVFQILEAPTTPVRNPALIPTMLEVVSNMGEDESRAKALSLLNIAKLLNRYCLNSQTANFCDPGCNTDFILNTFLPMLSQGFQDPEKWKKLMSVQAVCALGSPYSIPYLQPIIQGANNEDIDVRISAIYCLTNDLLPKTAQEMVFDSLVPMMDNPTEFPEVRSIAFLVLTTWEPSLSWWEHVAISTWRENSAQVVSFIFSTLSSLSEGGDPRSRNAKRVINLAKHPQSSQRVSLARSTYLYLYEVVKNCQVGTSFKLAWLSSTKSVFPRSVYYQVQFVSVMGMIQREKGIFFTNVLQDLYRSVHPAFLLHKHYEDRDTFQELIMELAEELEITSSNTNGNGPFSFLLMTEPLPYLFGYPSEHNGNILRFLLFGDEQGIPLHVRMADSTLVLPSDLGLPILIKHEDDIVFTVDVNLRKEIIINYNNRKALKTNTLVAWSNGMAAGIGVDAAIDVNLPLKISLEKEMKSMKVVLGLSAEKKVKIVSLSNIMYTSLTPLYHAVDSVLTSEESDSTNLGRKVIWNRKAHETRSLLLPELDIHLQSTWISDLKQPLDFNSLFKITSFTELKYRNLDYRLVLDPENSRTKSVTFLFSFDTKEREQSFPEQVSGDLNQQSQELGDYELFSQMSQTSSSGHVDFGQSPDEVIFDRQEQHSQTLSSHLSKMQEQMTSPMGGKVFTAIMAMEPQNSLLKYEIAVTVASGSGNVEDKVATNIHVVFMTSPMPGTLSDTHLACLDLKMDTPYLLPLLPKEELVEKDLTSKFLMNFYNGVNCDGPPEIRIEGSLDVSSAAIQNIWSTEMINNCTREIPKQSHLFYDQAIIRSTWTKNFVNWPMVTQTVAVIQKEFFPIVKMISEATPLDNEFTAHAFLNPEEGEWKVTVSGPRETSIFFGPGLLISPFSGFDTFDNLQKVCHVTYQSVKTYDGFLRPFQPSSCWATATIFSHTNSQMQRLENTEIHNHLQLAVQVRFSDQWEVRLIMPGYAIVIDVTRSDIMVNEEPLIHHNEKFVFHRLQDSMVVGIGSIVVRVGDSVDIMVSDLYYGAVKGVCGNYDGEPINDMTGPTGCHYTDPTLNIIAWSTPAVGCSRFTLRNKKRALAEYREGCDKDVFQPTDISQHNTMKNCTEWMYDERHDPTGLYCKTKVPIPKCRPGCHPGNTLLKHLAYSCRKSSSLGQDGVQYGENAQCFSTVSPIPYQSGCAYM